MGNRKLENRTRPQYDEDRRVAVRELAATLARRPERVADELKDSAPGCDHLIRRWEILAKQLDAKGRWTAERIGEAYDLLGVSEADRDGDESLPLGNRKAMLRRIQDEVDELEARRSGALAEREDRLYRESCEGMGLEEEPEIKRYRRYEREALREERRAIANLLADQELQRAVAATAAPEPQPEPARTPVVEAPPAPVAEAAATADEPAPAPSPNPPTPPSPAGPTPSVSGLVEGPEGPITRPDLR